MDIFSVKISGRLSLSRLNNPVGLFHMTYQLAVVKTFPLTAERSAADTEDLTHLWKCLTTTVLKTDRSANPCGTSVVGNSHLVKLCF